MTDKSMEWQEPLTPWRIVQRRFFAEGLDVASFSQKYGLNEDEVRKVFAELRVDFWPELCAALSRETKMSEQFFANLSDQYQRMAA
jgi:plasmid maintenance system antidote protein VapI